MTVLGVGTDVVDVPSFAEQLLQPGSRLGEVFTARERRRANQRAVDLEGQESAAPTHLAATWALKEAFIKAWSGALNGIAPPLARDDVAWPEIEVRHDAWGRPSISLRGKIRDWVAKTLGVAETEDLSLHASASHDGDIACALVVLEK